MDGAILHNNPVQIAIAEARRLSLERGLNTKPDIVLSIGTGQPIDGQTSEFEEPMTASRNLSKEKMIMRHRKVLPFLHLLFTMVSYQVKLNIDCERRHDQVSREWQKDPELRDRLHRFNPDLGQEPPPLDAVQSVDDIIRSTRGWLQEKDEKMRIHAMACKLVASSFYFERRGNASKVQGSSIKVSGIIRCRLVDTTEVMALGKFFSSCIHEPTFVIINYSCADEETEIPIRTMASQGRFDGVEMNITVLGEEAVTSIELKLERDGLPDQRLYRLSGFPRKLIKEDFKESRVA